MPHAKPKLTPVRIRKQWRCWYPGDVAGFTDPVCAALIDQGIAEPLATKGIDEPPVDKMVKAAPKAKKAKKKQPPKRAGTAKKKSK